MAIHVIIQYKSGLFPDIILLIQCYYHRGTKFYIIFCIETLYPFRTVCKFYIIFCIEKNRPGTKRVKYHQEVLSLQPMIPPKRCDIFLLLTGGCSRSSDLFLLNRKSYVMV